MFIEKYTTLFENFSPHATDQIFKEKNILCKPG